MVSSSSGLFSDIGLEVVTLPEVGSSVDNVETWASSDAERSFNVDFAAAGYCEIGLEASVPFWEILSKEVTLLSGAFDPEVFFVGSEDEDLSNDEDEDLSIGMDSGDSAGVGIALETGGSSLTTFFVSFLELLNEKPLFDDVCNAKTGSAAALQFDTGRKTGASSDGDLDAFSSFDNGFKL